MTPELKDRRVLVIGRAGGIAQAVVMAAIATASENRTSSSPNAISTMMPATIQIASPNACELRCPLKVVCNMSASLKSRSPSDLVACCM